MNQGFPFIKVKQNEKEIFLTVLPAGTLATIAYIARRGQEDEEGAVQRILNKRRLGEIRDYALKIGDFPVSFVLNWVDSDNPLKFTNNTIHFRETTSAQLIDGQHRLEGLKLAIEQSQSVANIELPVAIYQNLGTSECADVFLSINEKQKTVSKSLVYDLYGLASDQISDQASVRARDIAFFLNQEENSPFYGEIKFPGAARRRGGIALSTVVDALKPLVGEKGRLDQIGVKYLADQQKVILQFFQMLKAKYGDKWDQTTNAFRYAAGFQGAVEFFNLEMIPFCKDKKSFKVEIMSTPLLMDQENIILQPTLKGLSGKDAARKVYDTLLNLFRTDEEKMAYDI